MMGADQNVMRIDTDADLRAVLSRLGAQYHDPKRIIRVGMVAILRNSPIMRRMLKLDANAAWIGGYTIYDADEVEL